MSRVFKSLRPVCFLLACVLALSQGGAAQIRIVASPPPRAAQPRPHPEDLIGTMLTLNLCVDASTTYPCPSPITSDAVYIPAISLTYGQTLNGVVVYGTADGSGLNSGTITIYKDITAICALVIGVNLSCPPNSTIFDVGDYTLSATLTFPAGSVYANSTAKPVAISVAKDPTSIALSSSATPAALGSPVTITAAVSGSFPATPTGVVEFAFDGTAIPTSTLDATGKASFTTSTLALGLHTITAAYAGATNFLPAEDATFKQQIVPPATVTTIASSLNPSTAGAAVTFTSTVSPAAGPVVIPTGAVTFKDGTASFATVLVAARGTQNVAQTTISTLAAGTHNITAIYSGDTATSASVSKVLVQQVDFPLALPAPGYTITVTPAAVTLIAGATADLTVTVTPVSGFDGAVLLGCSDLPNEAACTFGEATIPSGGGTTSLVLTTMSPHDCNSDVPYGGFGSLHKPASIFGKTVAYTGSALAGVLLLLRPRRRHSLKALLSGIAVCTLASLSGCSSRCTDFGTAPGHYTFKVSGSAPATTPVTTGSTPASSTETPSVSTSVALSVKL